MAKSANSKVVFVPMQLQSDVGTQLANASGSGSGYNAMIQNEASGGGDGPLGAASRIGVLNSVSEM
jgi:erythrocyte band 7 integral membrane protein